MQQPSQYHRHMQASTECQISKMDPCLYLDLDPHESSPVAFHVVYELGSFLGELDQVLSFALYYHHGFSR